MNIVKRNLWSKENSKRHVSFQAVILVTLRSAVIFHISMEVRDKSALVALGNDVILPIVVDNLTGISFRLQ